MARRPVYQQQIDPIPSNIERHMRVLEFSQSDTYIDWCWANGFDGSFDKSKVDLQEELDAFKLLAEKRRKQLNLHKNPKAFLQAVCLGDLTSDEIDRPVFKSVAQEIEGSNEAIEIRQSLLESLLILLKFGDLVFQSTNSPNETPFIRGIIKLHDRKALWLRPLEDWKPKSKNRARMFGELTHYLFDKYGDVPRFMELVWLRIDQPSWRYRDWYVHIGRGYNFRKAKLPVPLTKKMAHHFLSAPDDYTAEQAVRRGQLKSLSVSDVLIERIIATQLGRSFEHEEFWFTVLRFFGDNPMLDPRQVGPIVDYLQNQKYVGNEVEDAPGEWHREPPPQPGLSMQGRTVTTLLRQVEEWHNALGRLRNLPNAPYKRSPFDGFSAERQSPKGPVRWKIRQLLNARDLQMESEALSHCVSSYHWSCAAGNCTIWSLSAEFGAQKTERRQTIEVDQNRTIIQCRGLANRNATPEEWAIVKAWAKEANLGLSNYF